MSEALQLAITAGVFGFAGLIPAYIINKRSARKSDFEAAQTANQTAFENLKALYDTQGKRLDEVIEDNKHYRTENAHLMQRNTLLEDENREYIKQISNQKVTIADLTSRVEKLEGKTTTTNCK